MTQKFRKWYTLHISDLVFVLTIGAVFMVTIELGTYNHLSSDLTKEVIITETFSDVKNALQNELNILTVNQTQLHDQNVTLENKLQLLLGHVQQMNKVRLTSGRSIQSEYNAKIQHIRKELRITKDRARDIQAEIDSFNEENAHLRASIEAHQTENLQLTDENYQLRLKPRALLVEALNRAEKITAKAKKISSIHLQLLSNYLDESLAINISKDNHVVDPTTYEYTCQYASPGEAPPEGDIAETKMEMLVSVNHNLEPGIYRIEVLCDTLLVSSLWVNYR